MDGLPIVGEGATTKIYRDGDRAIKLYRDADIREVEAEAARQSYAARQGLPVPEVYGVRRVGEGIALDMAYIPGWPLMTEGMGHGEVPAALRILVELQRMVHACAAGVFPSQRNKLAGDIAGNRCIRNETRQSLLARLDELCARDAAPPCLCHGDFHPLNVLYDGATHWIVDWVDATSGSAAADACRTLIIFEEYIPGLSSVYLQLFTEASGIPETDVLDWRPVVAAARMAERMDDGNREVLHDIVRQWTQTR